MTDVLALCSQLPQRELAAGEVLITEGERVDCLYILVDGAVEVVREGVRVVTVTEPGAFLGEMSALLGTTFSASVRATVPTRVRVLAGAADAVQRDPALTFAIARLLARRLTALTAYLVDIKQQYAETDTHLAVMDEVLARLMNMQRETAPTGSEREDVPDY